MRWHGRRIQHITAVLLAMTVAVVPNGMMQHRDGHIPLNFYDDLRRLPSGLYEMRQDSAVVRVLDTLRLCQITSLLPITTRQLNKTSGEVQIQPRGSNLYNEAAALLAVKHFNERSSVIVNGLSKRLETCNLYLTIDLRDSQLSPIEASRQTLETVNARHSLETPLPMGIMGAIRSSVSLPVGVLAGVHRVPQISPTSTSSQLENRGIVPYFARTIPTNAGDAKALVLYLQSIGVSHFGVAYARGPYGSEYYSDLSQAAQQYNMTAVGVSYEDSNLEASLESMITRLNETEFRYFCGIFFDSNYKYILDKLYRAGLAGNSKHVWFFTDSLAFMAQPGFQLNRAETNVAKVINGAGLIYLKVTANQELDQGVLEFMANEESRQYFISRHAERDIFGAFSLDDIPTRTSAFNTMVYDAIMTLGIAACETPVEFFTGPQLYEQMKRTNFTGASGFAAFHESATRREDTVSFQIINLVQRVNDSGDFIRFDSTQSVLVNSKVNITAPYIYFDGTSNPPPALPHVDVNLNLMEIGVRIMGWTLAGIVMIMSVGWMVWAFRNRKRPVIRASQPIFLCMLCTGTFIMASCIIPLSLQEPISQRGLDIACQSAPWLFSVGWVTSFSALFSKAYRLNMLFEHSRECRRVKISASDVLWPFLSLLSINIVILTIWTVVAPLQWTRKEESNFDNFGRSIESYGTCEVDHDKDVANYIFLILMVAVNASALIFATYQTWKSRHLPPSNYKESKYIAISLLSMLEAFVLAIPILFVVPGNPSGDFVVTTLLVTIVCLAILIPIFVPKYRRRNEGIEHCSSYRRSVTTTRSKVAYAQALASIEFAAARERSKTPVDQNDPLMASERTERTAS